MARHKTYTAEYRNYYLPPEFPAYLHSGDYWIISDQYKDSAHFHNCLEIGICHKGNGVMQFDNESFLYKEGDVSFIPKNITHATFSMPGTVCLWSYIFIDFKTMFESVSYLDKPIDPNFLSKERSHYLYSKSEYPEIYHTINAIVKEMTEMKADYKSAVRGLLFTLYFYVKRAAEDMHEASGQKEELVTEQKLIPINPALKFIEKNYAQQFSIKTLADVCHWSVTHFRRMFISILGVSPLEYINNYRINQACILLKSGNDSILNISEAVGFHSVSSFNRCFYKQKQMSPRDYRRHLEKD